MSGLARSIGRFIGRAVGASIANPYEGGGVPYDKLAIPRAFTTSLAANTSDRRLLILGDSIGNEYTTNPEWVARMDPLWAAFAPNYVVRDRLYNDATDLYVAQQIAGDSAGASLFSDNFNRADGAVGTSSGGGTYGTATAWAISGNHLVQNTFANLLTPSANLGNDTHKISIDYTKGNSASDGVRVYGLYTSATSCVYLALVNSGALSLNINTGSGLALATISTGATLSTGETITVELTIDGDWLTARATRGAVVTSTTFQLTAVQRAALTGTKFAIGALANTSGAYFDNLAVNSIAETRRLDIFNASVSGMGIAFHRAELATTRPVDMDAVVIALGHNEGTADVPTYLAAMDTLVTDLRTAQPGLPIIIMSENPQISPATNRVYANARQEALPAWAASHGYGLLDRYPTYNTVYTIADGIHPTGPGSAQIASENASDFAII